MTWSEILSAVRMALATIREHKMRSLLTVLGVIIGTGTVIAVGSIITGVDGAVVDAMRSMGPETGFVYQFNIMLRTSRPTREERARKPLQWGDVLRSGITARRSRPCPRICSLPASSLGRRPTVSVTRGTTSTISISRVRMRTT
jgi:hypothetical protein